MREIKFRAWDGTKMLHDVGFHPSINEKHQDYKDGEAGQFTICPKFDNYKLMQYTGLKDKNGVEIYEGDIICYRYTGGINIGNIIKKMEVKWGVFNIGSNGFEYDNFINGPYVEDEYMYILMINSEVEIIGNIYQNPELLK